MSVLTWVKGFVASALMAQTLACEPADPAELVVIPGDHVDYQHSPELEPCGGNLAAINGFAVYTGAMLGLEPAELPHATFSWLTEGDYLARVDGRCEQAIGCATQTNAYCRSPIRHHEIAHALTSRGHPLLEEGLAVALDPAGSLSAANFSARDPRPLLTAFDFESQAYDAAGLFVAYLLQMYGSERFLRLYAAIPRKSSLAEWEAALMEIHGRSVDAFVEEYLATTACPPGVAPFPRFECSAPQLVSRDGVITFERVLDCADDDVEGGIAVEPFEWAEERGGGAFELTRTFVVESAGEYDLAVTAPRNEAGWIGYASFVSCSGCTWLPQLGTPVRGDETARVWLEAERYYFTIAVFGREPQEVTVTIKPAP